MEIKDGFSAAVLEVLDKDNYVAWSAREKTYLIAQDLWETIEATVEPPKQEVAEASFKAWSNKNSMALHVLQVSCGPDILSMIRKISSAKIAWNTLTVILQVLKKDNYVDWSVRVKDYLMAHHLWEIIEETTQPPMQEDDEAAFKAWTKKNSMALHVIQISCGPDSFSDIIGISSAKVAWDSLAKKYLHVLEEDNYVDWSVQVKTYLMAHDLWETVEATTDPPKQEGDEPAFKAWSKKNSMALHVIQISCGPDSFSEIIGISSAKVAWDTLRKKFNSGNLAAGDRYDRYRTLRSAIYRGDWKAAIDFLSLHEDARSAKLAEHGGTVLHVAVFAGRTEMVEKLVELLSAEELELKDRGGYTALARAAYRQKTRMVDCMLTKNSNLLNIRDNLDCIPLVAALQVGNLEVARHLYSVYRPHQTLRDIDASTALFHFMFRKNFDLALHLLHRCPASAFVPNMLGTSALEALAFHPFAFPSGNQLVFWKSWIYACIPIRSAYSSNEIQIEIDNPNQHRNDQVLNVGRSVLGLLRRLSLDLLKLLGIKQIYEMKLLHHQAHQLLLQLCSHVKQMNRDQVKRAVFIAVRRGIVEFIDEILKVDGTFVYETNEMGRSIIYYAVLRRQAKVYRLIYGIVKNNWTAQVRVTDNSNNGLLHMTGMLEPSTPRDRIAGEALKMQSELQWFKEVERIHFDMGESGINDRNMTAKEFFTHNHMDMMKKGEKWMKATATSCTVVGALIITIMFTAAFTVPGGNNQNTGFPMFSNENLFTVFILSDALSLISSSTSVLVFLSILTSRYAEEDFLRSLPTKMLIGLLTLFFSIATMMITFCVGLYIMLPEKSWVVIPVSGLASVTVIQFGFMQIPLLVDMLKSTINVWTDSLW